MNLTPEQIERNREFLKDLRANEKKAIGTMRTSDGSGRCCLCVALESANRLGAGLPDIPGMRLPPNDLYPYYGWPSELWLSWKGTEGMALSFNDGTGDRPELTHAEIADAFEETFPELREPQPE